MKRIRLAILACALAAALPVAADAAENPGKLAVRVLCTAPGFALQKLHAHLPDGSATLGGLQVKSYLNHEYDFLNAAPERFVLTSKANPASAKLTDDLVATVDLPTGLKSLILFLLPEPGRAGSQRCTALAVADDAKRFPAGSIKVLNLSTLPVKIELEKKEFEFKAGEVRGIEDPPVDESSASSVRAFGKRKDGWQMFSSSRWPHPGGKRVLQVITENPVSKQLEMRGVRDVVAP